MMMLESLAMAMGLVLGAELSAELSKKKAALVDRYDGIWPLAIFKDGGWIGRIWNKAGVETALSFLPSGVRARTIRSMTEDLYNGDVWIYTYIPPIGPECSTLVVAPERSWDTFSPDSELLSRFTLYPRFKDRAQIRGAWLWWLYNALNPEQWAPADRWAVYTTMVPRGGGQVSALNPRREVRHVNHLQILSALHVPVLLAPGGIEHVRSTALYDELLSTIRRVENGQRDKNDVYPVTIRVLRLLRNKQDESCSSTIHGQWNVHWGNLGLRLQRSQPHTTEVVGKGVGIWWGSLKKPGDLPSAPMWHFTLHPMGMHEDNKNSDVSDFDLLDLLVKTDSILPSDRFEDWIESKMVHGELLYNPVPFNLLDEPDPSMMEFRKFRGWIERPITSEEQP